MNNYGRILGLDVGKKRIGSAISDELGISIKPYKIFEVKSINETLKEIIRSCQTENIHTIIIGYPLNLEGNKNDQSAFTENVIKRLIKLSSNQTVNLDDLHFQTFKEIKTDLFSIIIIDERFSSVEAENIIKDKSLKNKSRREAKDNLSAILILETFINAKLQ